MKYLITLFAHLITGCVLYMSETEASQVLEDFPTINQRALAGASDRCGSIALASWLVWLSKNGHPELVPPQSNRPTGHIFEKAKLDPISHRILPLFDALCKGNGAIKSLDLVQALVAYTHNLEDPSLSVRIVYYNLPDASLLRQIYDQKGRITLLHGIYEPTPENGLLKRKYGHYTNLIGYTEKTLIGHTYGEAYTFQLDPIPMNLLEPRDRYKPKGGVSLVYLRYPETEYPHYDFRSLVPQNRDQALKQSNLEKPLFADSEQTILLEGALVFWIRNESTK